MKYNKKYIFTFDKDNLSRDQLFFAYNYDHIIDLPMNIYKLIREHHQLSKIYSNLN